MGGSFILDPIRGRVWVPEGEPTPAEIRARCEAIQATWSDTQRRARQSWGDFNWTVPASTVDVPPEDL